MKSRKVKAAAKSKAFVSKKKLKGNLALDVSGSGSDVDSDSFYYDDIDDFHKKKDDELSTDDELIQHQVDSSEEEEVLPITDDDDSDENDLEKDDSSHDSEDDLPNPEAWGRKKSLYYNADFVDEDRGRTYREEDAEAAKAEADEAFGIQRSVFSNISADHLGANLFLEDISESSDEEKEKEMDLVSAPKQEKIKFLKKTSPEMFDFVEKFKSSLQEIHDKLLPVLNLAQENSLPLKGCEDYLRIKIQLLLHYSLNICFYMTLKSSGKKINRHPVLQRINAFNKFIDDLKPMDVAVRNNTNVLLENLRKIRELNGSKNTPASNENVIQRFSISDSSDSSDEDEVFKENVIKKKPKRKFLETEPEKEIISLITEVKEEMKRRRIEEKSEADDMPQNEESESGKESDYTSSEEKRAITYEIAKNKGLVPRRKKEYRNPRVRHRMKFRKAKIRRKGQVREVIKEIKRYEGEPTGISTHVVRSIKLK